MREEGGKTEALAVAVQAREAGYYHAQALRRVLAVPDLPLAPQLQLLEDCGSFWVVKELRGYSFGKTCNHLVNFSEI